MKRLAWLLLPALAACSADVRRFVPDHADMAQMAHLIALTDTPGVALHRDGHYQFIWTVDGKFSKSDWGLRTLPSDLYLTPGTHQFTVLYQHAGLSAKPRFEIALKAGTSYYVHHRPEGYGVRFWVTEGTQDGPRVGEYLPSP